MNGMTPFRQRILTDVQTHPQSSVDDIAERLDIAPTMIQVGLRFLWAAELVERDHQKHGKAWRYLYTAINHD